MCLGEFAVPSFSLFNFWYFLSKVLKSRVDNYGKQFRDADGFSKEIQKDPLIEDEKAKQIEDQAQDMINRWSALKYALEGRIDRSVGMKQCFKHFLCS